MACLAKEVGHTMVYFFVHVELEGSNIGKRASLIES